MARGDLAVAHPAPDLGIEMVAPARSPSRYHALRTSRGVLGRMAPLVRLGLFGAGVAIFLDRVRPLVSDAQFTWGERRVMGAVALVVLGGFGVAAWVAGRLLRASAEMIDLFIDGADAAWRTADLVELQVVPALGRIATALERRPPDAPGDPARLAAVGAVRRAIADRRWDEAEQMIAGIARDLPGSAEAAALPGELGASREAVVAEIRDRLDAARQAGDADRVIDARDELTQHLRGERLKDLDREVVRWLAGLMQARIRSGDVGPGTARLAGRVADSFGDTPEGASLRAALPGLRRKAGLCPECGHPYRGSRDVCPQCLARGARPAPAAPSRRPSLGNPP